MKTNKYLFAIFLIIFIDLLGFSLIIPLLPSYAALFRTSQFTVGLLASIYAIGEMVADPLFGRLSDRIGRRPVFFISILGNFISFMIFGLANSLWLLFLSRLIAGGTGGNISTAQAYISDVTDEKSRAKSFGLIGAAFGLGFILGPAFGGFLSRFGLGVPAFVAAGLAFVNLILVFFWLPETISAEHRASLPQHKKPPFTLRALIETLRLPLVGPLLNTRFFFALTFSLFTIIFPSYGFLKFHLNSQNTGYILAYVGVLSVIVQAFLIGRLSKRFSESQLIFAASGLLAVSLIGWAFSSTIWMILIVFIPTSLAGGVFSTVISSALSKAVKSTEVGGTLGISSSLESLSRVVAPVLGGFLLTSVGTFAPGVFGGLLLVGLTIFVWFSIIRPKSAVIQSESIKE